MNSKPIRLALLVHFPIFAILALQCAGLARAAAPDLSFTPATLDFKYQLGGATPATQNLQIKSTGTALVFTVSLTGPLPYSAQWLMVSANGGTTPATLKVYVNPTGLPAGIYSGTIVLSATGAATASQNVPVTLAVGDAPSSLQASVPSLTFNYVTGDLAPPPQPIVLVTTGGALNASITVSGGTWLKALPSGSIALVGLPGTVTVTVDPLNPVVLAPAAYTGKITFASSNNAYKSIVVNVTLNVSAGLPRISSGGLWPPGALVNSPPTVVTITGGNFFPSSTASVVTTAATTVLTTSVISSTTLLATIPAALLTSAGNLSITVTTPSATSPSAPAAFAVWGPGPQVWAVANAASYTTSTVSPGEIITIYGIGLGPTGLTPFPGTSPLPASLPVNGTATSVDIGGVSAPLLYTSATQVSCIVPYAVANNSGSSVMLAVTYGGVASADFPVDVVDTDPGVFTVDSSGRGQGAILNYNAATDDYSVNSSSNAAVKGSIVVIYATGFGTTGCISTDDSICLPAPDETRLITGTVSPAATVAVTIGGQAAAVQAALVPIGSVAGLLQINATVPTNITAGNAVPVVVFVGSAKSQVKVTMAAK